MTAAGPTALATAHGMVDGTHGDAANMRAFAKMSLSPGLPKFDVHVLDVANLPYGGFTFEVYHADFPTWKFDLGVFPLFGAELGGLSGGSDEFPSTPWACFDIMYFESQGDVF